MLSHCLTCRQKLIFTLAMLVIFRFIAHVPIPGVDLAALQKIFDRSQLLGMLDLFSGGAMRYFSIAAMGVYPYITSSIIMQLLVPVIPALRRLSEEGESGTEQDQPDNSLAYDTAGCAAGLCPVAAAYAARAAYWKPVPLETVAIIVSLTAGTMFCVWLGELITERGIGNGVSIIIFGGIIAGCRNRLGGGIDSRTGSTGRASASLVLLALANGCSDRDFHRRTSPHTGAVCQHCFQGRQDVPSGRFHLYPLAR